MSTCPDCHLVVASLDSSGRCARCEARSQAAADWHRLVSAPHCPCGNPMQRCDACGALYCRAPGHAVHVCEVRNVE